MKNVFAGACVLQQSLQPLSVIVATVQAAFGQQKRSDPGLQAQTLPITHIRVFILGMVRQHQTPPRVLVQGPGQSGLHPATQTGQPGWPSIKINAGLLPWNPGERRETPFIDFLVKKVIQNKLGGEGEVKIIQPVAGERLFIVKEEPVLIEVIHSPTNPIMDEDMVLPAGIQITDPGRPLPFLPYRLFLERRDLIQDLL